MFIAYTPQDANRALPEVKRRFNTIVSQKNHVVAIQRELQMIIESGSTLERFIKKKQEAKFSCYESLQINRAT